MKPYLADCREKFGSRVLCLVLPVCLSFLGKHCSVEWYFYSDCHTALKVYCNYIPNRGRCKNDDLDFLSSRHCLQGITPKTDVRSKIEKMNRSMLEVFLQGVGSSNPNS